MKWIDWVGHYKNILSDELCNQIIDYKFDYVKSTYSTHKGLSANKNRVEMDEIWIRKDHTFYKDLNNAVSKVAEKYAIKMKSFHDRYFVVQIYLNENECTLNTITVSFRGLSVSTTAILNLM